MATPNVRLRDDAHLRDTTTTQGYFTPSAERRFASDRAHRGDIEGALGRISSYDTAPRHTARQRLLTLLAVMGPGVVVMVADNDAGGISLYAQAGKVFGLRLLWGLLLLAPILYVNQEMSSRLGAVTGSGHTRLIRRRFGKGWGSFAISDLLLVNLLTIVTEIVGVRFALGYFGISQYISVPLAAVVLIATVSTGSFRRWERTMYVCVAASFCVIPLALLSHSHPQGTLVAVVSGSKITASHGVLLAIALIGSTVAPWQLFLQQSNVVDKRITTRWVGFERADTAIGTVIFLLSGAAITFCCATAFSRTNLASRLANASVIAHDLRLTDGSVVGALFAIVLLNGSILGASAVSLATSYAVGDYFGLKHSLHRSWREAPMFHTTFACSVLVAAGVVLIPGAPLGLVTTTVQALAGILLPSASVLLLLLCNDQAVLGPWTNPMWLNLIATAVLGLVLALSTLLVTTTLFPGLAIATTAIGIGISVVAVFAVLVVRELSRPTPREVASHEEIHQDRMLWSMPDSDSLQRPVASMKRTFWLSVLRGYLIFSTIVLIIRFVRMALGN